MEGARASHHPLGKSQNPVSEMGNEPQQNGEKIAIKW